MSRDGTSGWNPLPGQERVIIRKLEPEEVRVLRRPKDPPPGFWQALLVEHLLPLVPGDRIELEQRPPRRWSPETFILNARRAIRRIVVPNSPWRYKCSLTTRMTVLVRVLP